MDDNKTSPIDQVAEFFGGFPLLASALNVSVQAAYKFRKAVPPKRCVQIEKLTEGKFGRKILRPDDWEEIWPELVNERRLKPYRRTDRRSNK
jgi:DNA-binding transcriptional regulator YdaS (Cro superfamily)